MTIVKVLIQSSRNDVLDFVLVLFAFELNEGSGTVQRLRFYFVCPLVFLKQFSQDSKNVALILNGVPQLVFALLKIRVFLTKYLNFQVNCVFVRVNPDLYNEAEVVPCRSRCYVSFTDAIQASTDIMTNHTLPSN